MPVDNIANLFVLHKQIAPNVQKKEVFGGLKRCLGPPEVFGRPDRCLRPSQVFGAPRGVCGPWQVFGALTCVWGPQRVSQCSCFYVPRGDRHVDVVRDYLPGSLRSDYMNIHTTYSLILHCIMSLLLKSAYSPLTISPSGVSSFKQPIRHSSGLISRPFESIY